MNYSNKLKQKLAYLNFKFPSSELDKPQVLQLNNQYSILPITAELLDQYQLLQDFLVSCYTDSFEFANLFGIDNQYSELLDKPSKDKVIMEFYYDKAKKNKIEHDIFIANYIIINSQRKPVGVLGTCDYKEFPREYKNSDGKTIRADDTCIFLSILVAKKYRRKGLYKLGFTYLCHLIKSKNLRCCQTITHDNVISQEAAKKLNFEFKGYNLPKEDFKKEIYLFEK